MVVIDGEKYACEACIRGHRVSSCNHTERDLIHVARKGRPISQCQHCRGQRKARSQHTNCQCATNGHDKDHCPKKGTGSRDDCCCSHTNQCTCAIKKDKSAQATTGHDEHDSPKPMAHIKNCHDNKPMIFTGNGHHKPVHKFNDAHNHLGSPYKIPSRASSVNHHTSSYAQRSSDSLPLAKFARPHHESPLHHQLTPRQIKSEHNSPMMRPTNMQNNIPNDLQLPMFDPNAYSFSPFSSNTSTIPYNNVNTSGFDDQFSGGFSVPLSQPEEVQPQPNVDWGSYDFTGLPNSNSTAMMNDATFLTNSALASEQFGNLNLGMTPSSASDIDEFGFARTDQPRSQSGDASTGVSGVSSPDNSQFDHYRHSVEGTPQLQTSTLVKEDSLDIDDYLRQAQEETKRLSIQNQMRQMAHIQAALSQNNSQENLPQIKSPQSKSHTPVSGGMHPYSVHEAQERAHSTGATPVPEAKAGLVMPNSFAGDPYMSNPTFTLDDAQEDEDWVR